MKVVNLPRLKPLDHAVFDRTSQEGLIFGRMRWLVRPMVKYRFVGIPDATKTLRRQRRLVAVELSGSTAVEWLEKVTLEEEMTAIGAAKPG